MTQVVQLRPLRRPAEVRADAWEALVRMMEANGRTRIEVGLGEVREVALVMRAAASRG